MREITLPFTCLQAFNVFFICMVGVFIIGIIHPDQPYQCGTVGDTMRCNAHVGFAQASGFAVMLVGSPFFYLYNIRDRIPFSISCRCNKK